MTRSVTEQFLKPEFSSAQLRAGSLVRICVAFEAAHAFPSLPEIPSPGAD